MAVLVRLIVSYSTWLYIACLIGTVMYLRAALIARREQKQAIFSLEREAAADRFSRSLIAAAMLVVISGGIFAINLYLSPYVSSLTEVTETPTPTLLTPSSTPSPSPCPTPTAAPSSTPRSTRRSQAAMPTATVTASPTHTVIPTPPLQPPRCLEPSARITAPAANAILQGTAQVIGSANIEGFQYYKLEFGVGPSPSAWSFIFSSEVPVTSGTLGSWNTEGIEPGIYTLRLVVVDRTGNYPEPCAVQVIVER